jgi:hypothetical protein
MAAKKKAKNNEPKFDAFGPAKAVVNNARAVANMMTNSSGPSMKAGQKQATPKPKSSMMAAAPKPTSSILSQALKPNVDPLKKMKPSILNEALKPNVDPFKKSQAPRPAPKKPYVAPYQSETPRGPRSGGKPLNTTPVPTPKKKTKPKGAGKNVPVWKF